MNSKLLRTLGVSLSAAVVLTSCDGLGKMVKKQKDIQYTVTPNPVEMKGDSVQFNVAAKFGPKLFAKKAVLTITPVMVYAGGGEKAFKPVTLVGESASGSGQKIPFSGGSLNYSSEKIPFEDGMRNSKVELRATAAMKGKSKNFDPVTLADGAMATSLLVRNDEKPVYGRSTFSNKGDGASNQKSNISTHIYYLINQSDVRSSEMNSQETKQFTDFISKNLGSPDYEFKGISVSAYASPDGETDKNENLAKDRANSASVALMNVFNKNKDKKVTFGKTKDQFKIGTTKEDWDGFKSAMEQSTMADKDLILRVLTMYSDPDQRRKEIKNLSATYTELAEKVLPKLRRAEITVTGGKKPRTDEHILRLATSKPDSLSVEEIIYAGTLTNDINTQVQIYQAAEKQYGSDWRTSNNLGCALLIQNKVADAAEAFKRADKVSGGQQPAVFNNLGILEAKNGNRPAAAELYKKAGGSAESNYNMGIIQVRDGNYSDASASFGSFKNHNKALAQLLGGDAAGAKETLESSDEKDAAYSLYLKAVIFARQGNNTEVINNLKAAIEKDNSYKAYAKDDIEFVKLRADSNFTGLLN